MEINKEYLKRLPKKIKDKFLYNLSQEKDVTKYLALKSHSFTNFIGGSFAWSDSPEGHHYWSRIAYSGGKNDSNVSKNLTQIKVLEEENKVYKKFIRQYDLLIKGGVVPSSFIYRLLHDYIQKDFMKELLRQNRTSPTHVSACLKGSTTYESFFRGAFSFDLSQKGYGYWWDIAERYQLGINFHNYDKIQTLIKVNKESIRVLRKQIHTHFLNVSK